MSGIRGKDTKPEIVVRRLLHGMGYRFRLHRKDLPGKPDIVLPKWRTVVFVNGCYWHGHSNCHLFRLPKSRTEFWTNKIDANRQRDTRNHRQLADSGWKAVIVWECAVLKKNRLDDKMFKQNFEQAILSPLIHIQIRGGA